MTWTPKSGALRLRDRVGDDVAFVLLTSMVGGEVWGEALTRPPYDAALADIANLQGAALVRFVTAERHGYWPRVWAARALAYLPALDAGPWLVEALDDPHWRVRMTAVQALGRTAQRGRATALHRLLRDDHRRVRGAAATALGRAGDASSTSHLEAALEDDEEEVREKAARALARLERADRPSHHIARPTR